MQKIQSWFRWVMIVSILAGVLGGTAQAQVLVFEEPFDDPDLSAWEYSPGVKISDGIFRVEPENIAFRPSIWGDSRLVAQIRLDGEGEALIGYRVANSNGFRIILGGDYVFAQREKDQEIIDLNGSGGIPIPWGEWFRLEIVMVEGLQQILINEQLVLELDDPDPYLEGGILFQTIGEITIEVDHFAVFVIDSRPEEASEPPVAVASSAEINFDDELAWVRTGGPLGGLGYDVRMNPENPDIMYVTDALAGVFKSIDGGRNWFPSNEGITVRAGLSRDDIPIFCLTISPNDPETIWAGTQNKRGLFKSEDGGASWVMKVNGIIEKEGITFRGITVDPKNPQIIYAAAEISSWTWAGKEMIGREFDKVKGVVYKSTNGGDSWQTDLAGR